MHNELLWFALLLASFTGIIIAYRIFGRTGLYAWTAMAIVLANIQVMKTIKFFGLVTAMGNIVYGTTFLVTDILCENYGKREAKKAVEVGFFVLIVFTLLMQICLAFIPDESDTLSPALEQIFGIMPRITVASLTAYLVSQLHDVWAFDFWKRRTKGRFLWLRNNASTMVSQLIDNAVFTWIAFVGFGVFWEQVFPWELIAEIFVTSYIMKFIVAALDTPFVYLAKMIKSDADRAEVVLKTH
ncbi:MAG: queuosine precursor transporter [Archaeoglobus sp.]|uniref:queuosine precursor transporter n=1 Tax=Archaeoglobus sp. TaxID=1872626 RepID=UPI001D8A24C3|nr:queuosine precursor transporter [Archaeoglobus sp.]MBO8179146.1 queuosine precursor transporter [Archaeoglobus sp.]